MRLRRHFDGPRIYPHFLDGARKERVISVPHLLERWQARRHEIEIIIGHFPLCTTSLLGGGFTTLTVLREPVERTLSFLRHHRYMWRKDRDKSLEQLYDTVELFRGFVQNHMVKMLALRTSEMTDGALTPIAFTRDHLERAKEQLSTIDAFGLQHRFEEFCGELTDRFGFCLGDPLTVNVTKPEPVSQALLDRIAEDNALDIELFDFACRLYDERSRDV